MFNIKPFIDPAASAEELRNISDREIDALFEYFATADIKDSPYITVQRGMFEYWNDRYDVEFRDYKSEVVSTYHTPDGDRWFVTADAGHINVTALVAKLKEAVDHARA